MNFAEDGNPEQELYTCRRLLSMFREVLRCSQASVRMAKHAGFEAKDFGELERQTFFAAKPPKPTLWNWHVGFLAFTEGRTHRCDLVFSDLQEGVLPEQLDDLRRSALRPLGLPETHTPLPTIVSMCRLSPVEK